MRLVRPDLIWLLLLLLPLAYVLWRMAMQARDLLPTWMARGSYRWHFPVLKNILRLLSLAFLLLALLGPTWGEGDAGKQALGRQVYFVLDVSASMNVQDIQPSRLQVAKREILRVAEKLQGEQLGLILFADVPFVQCPLTNDLETFKLFLDLASTNQFASTGTDYRTALGETYRRFLAERRDQPTDARMARAAVFVTDTDNHGEIKYQSWLEALEAQGVKLFVVGVGTPSGGPVPQFDADGKQTGFKHYPDGTLATARLAFDSLRSLAKTSGTGAIYTIENNNATLDELATAILNMPPGLVATPENLIPMDRFQWPLLLAILCLSASFVLLPQAVVPRYRAAKAIQQQSAQASTQPQPAQA